MYRGTVGLHGMCWKGPECGCNWESNHSLFRQPPPCSCLQVRVLWEGDSDWEELDGGAFAEWIEAGEESDSRRSGAPASSKAAQVRSKGAAQWHCMTNRHRGA